MKTITDPNGDVFEAKPIKAIYSTTKKKWGLISHKWVNGVTLTYQDGSGWEFGNFDSRKGADDFRDKLIASFREAGMV